MDASDSDFIPRPNYQAQKSGGVAYCPGYTDADGNWNNGFPCKRWGGPDENYCCGDDHKRFCCPERTSSVAGSHEPQMRAELRTTSKSRSISRSDQADAPGWAMNSDLRGQMVTPSFTPEANDGGLFQTLGRISGNVNFPLVPTIIVFSVTMLLLVSTVALICCCYCPSCPGGKSRRRRREAKASKFVKTTSVNLEAEETAAAIAAQALVSVGGFERHNFHDGAQILSCYSNTSVGKGQALLSGSSSATSSLPRGCVDFSCRSRQDNLSDQLSSIVPGCFQHKSNGASILRGHQMKPQHHVSEQLVESPSSSLQALVVQGQFMRNSPTTTSTSNSSEGANTAHPHNQPGYPNLGPALHYHCELRPSIEPRFMNVENLVSALYQNNQHIGAEMGWKTDVEAGLMSMSSLTNELNGNVLNAFPSDPSLSNGMDDSSINKWLSNTSQQLNPKRTPFSGSKCSHQVDVGGEAAERLLGDQSYHQLAQESQNKGLFRCSPTYPDVTQTCISSIEKQPFLENHDSDPTGKLKNKPDITPNFDEPMLSAIDIPNCPQLKLASGEWRLPKLRYDSNIHAIP